LYLLYTAELALVVARHGLNLHQYADNTQVYVSTSAKDAEAAVACLTACLVDIEAWLKASRLRLNHTKTQVMWLGSPQQLTKVNVLEVPVASTCINVSETARDLGVVVESQLSSLYRWPPCVAVAVTSYGSSERLSEQCQPRPCKDAGQGKNFVSPGLLKLSYAALQRVR